MYRPTPHQQDGPLSVKKQRKNLFMMWLDYRKAFDSVPHPCIIKALELAKVPNKILITIPNIMDLWAAKVDLFTHITSIETNTINYITGVLQGDCLSLMLFILSVKKEATFQLDLINQFTKDIGMKFGLHKCAYIYIERGIQKFLDTKLFINGTDIE